MKAGKDMKTCLLEVCAYNIQSCIVAEKSGAGRIELCANPLQGGVTPSYGMIQYAMEKVSIPIFPMIRPRGGNFIYDADEIAIMKKDIAMCRQLGCTGIATGVQLPNGDIDKETMGHLVAWAYPMQVTCHKAFDAAPDAFRSLEGLIGAGCHCILTSGLQKMAVEGAAMLAQLIAQAAGRIVIMPGGGVRAANLAQLIRATGAVAYHSSGLTSQSSDYIADGEEVRLMVNACA